MPFTASNVGSRVPGTYDCGTLFPIRVDGAGETTATDLGHPAYTSQECVDFSTYPFTSTGEFTLTASNVDPIVGSYTATATIAADGVTILYHQWATLTGGTGRFASATGQLEVNGAAYADGTYLERLEGTISSVGMEYVEVAMRAAEPPTVVGRARPAVALPIRRDPSGRRAFRR